MPALTEERFTGGALLPEVPACGRDDQHAARPGLKPHEHPGAFEICLLTRGEVDWWVEDELVTLRSGEVFFTRPGEWHGGVGSVLHPCELYWFQLVLRADDRPSGAGPDEAESIRRDLMSLPMRCFDASPELQRSIRELIEEHRDVGGHARLAARSALYTALVKLIREGKATSTAVLSDPVRKASAWMASRIEEPFTMPDVAAVAGLSTVRLQARFRRELHCSMDEHRTRLRVHTAKRLLRDTDESVTWIAIRLGLGSSQYFATLFRQRVGLTPSAYRDRYLFGRPTGGIRGEAAER